MSLYNLEKLTEFRHWMHQNCELSLVEFKTQQKITEYLTTNLKIPATSIIKSANTGLTIDIYGKAPPSPDSKPLLIAARADIDGLPLFEKNDLPYKSSIQSSHMCGHDGHTACLLGGISMYLDSTVDKIPSNRGVRFVFQPGEEGAGGARMMVQDNCLEGVSEIYGMHNMPKKELAGKVSVREGSMMAGLSKIYCRVIGVGGHGSKPESCKNPVPVACEVYLKINSILNDAMAADSTQKGSIPKIIGSNAMNVIPEDVVIEGTLRCFEKELPVKILNMMEEAAQEICNEKGFKLEMKNLPNFFKPVINEKSTTDWVMKAVEEVYGKGKGTTEGCPVFASEDFSDFTEDIPGCFWFTPHGINAEHVTLHSSEFRFDDGVIEPQSRLWNKLFELRLNN